MDMDIGLGAIESEPLGRMNEYAYILQSSTFSAVPGKRGNRGKRSGVVTPTVFETSNH